MALFRAMESQRPEGKRLFCDPLAASYLSPTLRVLLLADRLPFLNRMVAAIIDHRWPGARTTGVARTRLIDEAAEAALKAGLRQAVLLGAGFDSRPYRLHGMDKVVAFEVDHPATSEAKLKLTTAALGRIPSNVRFVRIDFNSQDLSVVLKNAGYDAALPTLFLWEGVTNYLTADAVQSTLLFCSRAAAQSEVVFTYIDSEVLSNPRSYPGTQKLAKLLSGVGEKWTFGFDPKQLPGYLERIGLKLKSDLSAAEYRQIYYKQEGRSMIGYEFYHVATATVTGTKVP
jgi:methyltransferase (TIGR00027 family)